MDKATVQVLSVRSPIDDLRRRCCHARHRRDERRSRDRAQTVMRRKPICALLYMYSGIIEQSMVTVVRTMLSLWGSLGGCRRKFPDGQEEYWVPGSRGCEGLA